MRSVTVLVANDLRHDSRTLHVASALAAADWQVTLVGLQPSGSTLPNLDSYHGIPIHRVRAPVAWPSWWPGPTRADKTPLDAPKPLPHAIVSLERWLDDRSGGAADWLVGWITRWQAWGEAVAAVVPPTDAYYVCDLLPAYAAERLRARWLAEAGSRRRRGPGIVFDARELLLESGRYAAQPGWAKAVLRRREGRFARRSDTVVTVSEPIRRVLVDRYRLAHTAVVYSCPPARRVDEPDPRLRRALGLEDAVPLVIAHGRLTVHRGLEQLCDAMRETVTGAHLAVLGYGPLYHQLKLDSERGDWAGRLHLLEAVEPDDLLDWLSGADLAAMPIQPSTLNHFFSAPNKLFEALNAGLPVVAPDFPVFRTVLQDEAGLLGSLVDPTNPLAIQRAIEEVLGRSSAERAELRRRCLRAARGNWTWERQSRTLLEVMERSVRGLPVEARA